MKSFTQHIDEANKQKQWIDAFHKALKACPSKQKDKLRIATEDYIGGLLAPGPWSIKKEREFDELLGVIEEVTEAHLDHNQVDPRKKNPFLR